MKKKILKILLRLLILIVIGVCIYFIVKFVNNKQVIGEDINDISIVCLDTNKETILKEEDILELTPHLADIYRIKDSNFNKWDLVPKIRIVINKKDVLKITDYDDTYYYGYFNDDNVKIPIDVYKISSKYCKEDQNG